MIYAKIKSRTQLEYAPKEIKHNGRRIINPSVEMLEQLGYMPVVHTEMPIETSYYFTAYYEVEGEQIVQKWEKHLQSKEIKISELSQECEDIITNGIDVELSDGNMYHFSLTVQDQLNLITLSEMVNQGIAQIPYHSDGKLCVYFSNEDMQIIINKATIFKTFHTTYFNSLKSYINAIDDESVIANIKYGDEIPLEHQSEVLKGLING